MHARLAMFLATVALGPITAHAQPQAAWSRTYHFEANQWVDRADAVAVDPAGNVYVTGSSRETPSSYDYATIKYDAAGQEQWVRRYNGTGDFIDLAFAAGLDAAGNLYVGGHSWGGGNFGTPPKYDIVVIKYDPDGVLVWEHRFNSAYDNDDFFADMAVTAAGEVYVTGYSYVPIGLPADADYVTYKIDAGGMLAWSHFYDGPQHELSWLSNAMAIDDAGNAFVGAVVVVDGESVFGAIKYDTEGATVWETSWSQPALPEGQPDFTQVFDVVVDAAGNTLLAGRYHTVEFGGEAAVVKFDAGGSHAWTQISSTPLADEFRRATTDAAGNVYLEGAFNVDNGLWLHADNLVAAFAADGAFLWEHRYGGTGEGFDGDGFVELDPAGRVVVALETVDDVTLGDFLAFVFDPADGAVLHEIRVDTGASEVALGLAVGEDGSIHLTGAVWQDATGWDYLTSKVVMAGGPDLNLDGIVDTVDFLALLAAWGPCPGCPADLDGNGVVDTVDMLALLAAWGP